MNKVCTENSIIGPKNVNLKKMFRKFYRSDRPTVKRQLLVISNYISSHSIFMYMSIYYTGSVFLIGTDDTCTLMLWEAESSKYSSPFLMEHIF